MGMVVLRSTTPCVAVNSRSNSALLTVISIVATAAPAATTPSTGIDLISPAARYFYYFPYIKYKTYKTSSNSRRVGEVENFAKSLYCHRRAPIPSCEKSVSNAARGREQDFRFCQFSHPLHSFHMRCTARRKEECGAWCKTPKYSRVTRPIAQSVYSEACLNLCRSCEPLRFFRLSAAR